jgi:hypothetical protein
MRQRYRTSLSDISSLEQVGFVMKGGVIYKIDGVVQSQEASSH